MKKLLALVLALVMVLSLCVVSSNAAYTDKTDIDLKEAADVMTAIGVFQGSDGKFDPKANLTREQAAKLVSYLQIGQKAADALVGGGKFTDVAKDRWSAGYVDYCASIGIAAGVGAGKFDPTGSLTALQFGKMLLVCLGYDAKAEGLTGTDWSINTSKLMSAADLLAGLKDVTAYSVVTREQAAQMMLNALKAPMVEYATKATSISVNGADVVFGGSTASYVTGKLSSANNISDAKLNDKTNEAIIELGEKLFPKLKLDEDFDAFMRPANVWTYKSQEIGTYTDAEDLLYTDSVELGQIYKDLGLGKTTHAAYYIDGVKQADDAIIAKSSTAEVGGHGTETYVYYFSSTGAVEICEVNWYIGDVAAAYKATATKDAYVTIAGRNAGPSGNFTTEKFAMDDVVLYNVSFKNATPAVKNVELAPAAITGTLTNYVAGKSATVGGTTYKYSNKIANVASGNLLNTAIEAEIVLDKYGFVIDIDCDAVKNYAVVLNAKDNMGTYGDTGVAKLLFTDATTKDVTLATNSLTDANGETLEPGDIVSYTVGSNGKYTLVQVADKISVAADATVTGDLVTNGAQGINAQFTAGARKANGKTIFLVKDSSGNYTAYTGIKNVPTIVAKAATRDGAFLINSFSNGDVGTDYANLVYIDGTYSNINTTSTIFVMFKASVTETKNDTIGNYYEYTAYVDGEETKLKVVPEQAKSTFDIYEAVSYDANGIATLGTELDTQGTGTVAAKNGVVGLAGTFYSYAKDCKVFYINSNNEVSASTVGAIATDANDYVWFKQDLAGDVTYIFIKEDGGVAATTYDVGTSTGMKFCKTNSTTAGDWKTELANLAPNTVVYVKTDDVQDAVKSTAVTLTEVQAPTSAKEGIYSFVITEDVAANALTKVDLVKVNKSTATVVASGVTFTVTTPATDLYVEAGTLVDITVTVSGIANNTKYAQLTVTGATAMTTPVAPEDAVVGNMNATTTSATTVKFTPANTEYYNATYTIKAAVGSAMSFALAAES